MAKGEISRVASTLPLSRSCGGEPHKKPEHEEFIRNATIQLSGGMTGHDRSIRIVSIGLFFPSFIPNPTSRIAMRWCVEHRFPGAVHLGVLMAVGVFPQSALSQTAVRANASPARLPISWTGPFVGAQVLGSLSNVNTTESTVATGARFHQFDTFASGGGGGFDFGYNWLPWRNNWLVGVIADINFLSDSGGHVFKTMDNLMASGQVRVGYLATPGLLCYGQTGVSLARESLKVDFGGSITEQSRVAPGYAIGAGAEWALPIAAPVPLAAAPSLFVDYQHIWWGSGTLDTPAAAPSLNFRWQRETNTIKAGLRFHF